MMQSRAVGTLKAEPLAWHGSCIPLVAQWFVSEWPNWYGPGGSGHVDRDLQGFAASEQCLPVGMLAFLDEIPVGLGALKAASIPGYEHLSPWAAAGFVLPQHRGRGIGAFLLKALVAKADELGYRSVYCGTSTADSLLVRAGWSAVAVTALDDKPLTIYRSTFSDRDRSLHPCPAK